MKLPATGNNPTLFRCAVRAAGAVQRAADLGRSHGGVMRKGRNIIISAILALGASGSILASAAVPAVVAQASSVQVLATGYHASPNSFYHT